MVPRNIQKKISELNYNIESLEYFLDIGRKKETLPIAVAILERFEELSLNLSGDQENGTSSFSAGSLSLSTFQEVSGKLSELSKRSMQVSEQELDEINYDEVCEKMGAAGRQVSAQIKKKYKNIFEKLVDQMLRLAILMLLIGAIIFVLRDQLAPNYWGLKADFYKGMNFEKKIASGISRKIDFNDYGAISDKLPNDTFTVRWTGFLLLPKDTLYTFMLVVNDGARLSIDDQLVIDAWKASPGKDQHGEGKLFLPKGPHRISVDYFESNANEKIKLYWQYEGQGKQIIPSKYFRFHEAYLTQK
jgi:hypothetical protein